jgi:hypothetical protein
VQLAVLPPSAVVTVIVEVPAATALTLPPWVTVATEVLLLDQLKFWFVEVDGDTVATRVWLPLSTRLKVAVSRLTPVTDTAVSDTVTAQLAVLPPSEAVAVIVALPAATAATVPFDTVATEGSLVDQLTLLFEAVAGAIVAKRVSEAPVRIVVLLLLRLTPETGVVTVTVQVAMKPPSLVFTVIVALPFAMAFTAPPEETVATVFLLLVQLRPWFVAPEGAIAATRVSAPPTARLKLLFLRLTPVTATDTGVGGVGATGEVQAIEKTAIIEAKASNVDLEYIFPP